MWMWIILGVVLYIGHIVGTYLLLRTAMRDIEGQMWTIQDRVKALSFGIMLPIIGLMLASGVFIVCLLNLIGDDEAKW